MSYYYKYDFISPESTFAIIQEELKAYFDTGAIDSLMFNTYLDKCLRKLGRSSYVISNEILYIDNFEARLPDNFHAVREAWLCTSVNGFPYQSPNSFYSQANSQTTIQVSPVISNGTPCSKGQCTTGCPECMPELIQAVYKTNNELNRTFRKEYLLTPGNISVRDHCDLQCANLGASGPNSFDIRDNKFVTNFRHGTVYLLFYANEYDDQQNQLIPDNYRIREYIEAFIKFKMFETLTNQTNDETFQQLQQKLVYYKQQSDEAFIMADLEIKKQTVYQKQRAIKSQLNKFQMYELPNSTPRFGWRRNGRY